MMVVIPTFTDEEAEVQRCEVTYLPKAHGLPVMESGGEAPVSSN